MAVFSGEVETTHRFSLLDLLLPAAHCALLFFGLMLSDQEYFLCCHPQHPGEKKCIKKQNTLLLLNQKNHRVSSTAEGVVNEIIYRCTTGENVAHPHDMLSQFFPPFLHLAGVSVTTASMSNIWIPPEVGQLVFL